MFEGQLIWGTVIVVATVVVHVAALVAVSELIKRIDSRTAWLRSKLGLFFVLDIAVSAIIFVHIIEAVGWAAIYCYLNEFQSFGKALYFSIVTSTTLGYGDITLSDQWQLLGSFEAMGGMILFGVSTAYFIGLMQYAYADATKAGKSTRSSERVFGE